MNRQPNKLGAERVAVISARSRRYLPVKSAVEWCTALVLLVLSSPLLAALAVLVKLTSDGPAFYTQMRLGRHGRPIRICKLRTMTFNCEASTGAVWALRDDPRATPLGRWLRHTHLDELPQLWNVLRGEMALIGPRPERPEIAADLEAALPDYPLRLLVRPGITGLAQMRLPADSDLPGVNHKLAHDLHYVSHLGLALDFRIATSTLLHFFAATAEAVSKRLVQPYAPPPYVASIQVRVEAKPLVQPPLLSRYQRAGEASGELAPLASAA